MAWGKFWFLFSCVLHAVLLGDVECGSLRHIFVLRDAEGQDDILLACLFEGATEKPPGKVLLIFLNVLEGTFFFCTASEAKLGNNEVVSLARIPLFISEQQTFGRRFIFAGAGAGG